MLEELSARLIEVPGVSGVMLGGSRGRGDHTDNSDYDLGLYYRRPVDLDALLAVAKEFGGPDATVTALGVWGPWTDGGAWLTVGGAAVVVRPDGPTGPELIGYVVPRAGAVLVEAHDEWQTGDRRYLGEATMALLTTPPPQEAVATPELMTA